MKVSQFGMASLTFVLATLCGAHASAQTLMGTLPITFEDLSLTPTSSDFLSAGVKIDMSSDLVHTSGGGTQDYSMVPFTAHPPYYTYYDLPANYMLNLSAPGDFSITNSLYGTFNGVFGYQFVTQTANYIDLALYGFYTPGTAPGMATKSRTETELSLYFSLVPGGTVFGSGELSSPGVASQQIGPTRVGSPFLPVPEPNSIAMFLGLGITGLGLLTRRRAH